MALKRLVRGRPKAQLPAELQEMVFEALEWRDHLLGVRHVCKKWKAISESPTSMVPREQALAAYNKRLWVENRNGNHRARDLRVYSMEEEPGDSAIFRDIGIMARLFTDMKQVSAPSRLIGKPLQRAISSHLRHIADAVAIGLEVFIHAQSHSVECTACELVVIVRDPTIARDSEAGRFVLQYADCLARALVPLVKAQMPWHVFGAKVKREECVVWFASEHLPQDG